MQLEILTPQAKLYTGNVYGVQMPGLDGLFEILENHAPILAALGAGTLKILNSKNDNSGKEFDIHGGFLELQNNHAVILLEGASEA